MITAAMVNAYLGQAVIDDTGSPGELFVNLSLLSGDALTTADDLAESIFKLLKAISETAAAEAVGTTTYPAIVRSIQNVNGEPKVRNSATVNVLADIDYDVAVGA